MEESSKSSILYFLLVLVILAYHPRARSHSEPEFRLVFMLPSMVMCGLGMFLFGYTMEIGAAAELCAFLQGIMMVGVLIGIFSTLAYALDAFRSQSNEMFVMNMFFKVRRFVKLPPRL